jgi:tRNA threonylcarbamoyladenosine biosynthesis protein TsaB
MTIVGIETATAVCGAAVVRDGKILSEEHVIEKNAHAESIMRLLDGVLQSARIAITDVDAVAASIGPGSFTGLRIGLSIVKGLAFALDKPVVAVPTLRALAQTAVDSGTVTTPYILTAIDARRDEVYCQLFRVEGTTISAEWDERDTAVGLLLDEIDGREITITGDAQQKLKYLEGHKNIRFVRNDIALCRAGTIALLGETMATRGEFSTVATLEPKYVKEFFTIMKN